MKKEDNNLLQYEEYIDDNFEKNIRDVNTIASKTMEMWTDKSQLKIGDIGTYFNAMKESYIRLRETYAVIITKYLLNHGYTNLDGTKEANRGKKGKGISCYSSGHQIVKYDLENWKWIEVAKEYYEQNEQNKHNVVFLISLQASDRDPRSSSSHALYDRIGVFAYLIQENLNGREIDVVKEYPLRVQENMITTDIELPLEKNDLDALAKMLDELGRQQVLMDKIQRKLKKKENFIK